MHKGLKITIKIIAILLAVTGLLILIASPTAKFYVNHHGEDLVGRKIHVKHLRINPLTGTISIKDLTLFEDNGTTPFVSFEKFNVSVKLFKLLSHEVYIKHLLLTELNVNILQNDNKFNFTSMLDHFKSDDKDDDTTSSTPWTLRFYNIELLHAKILYNDLQRNKEWNIPNLNLVIPGFVIGTDDKSEAGLTFALADGGWVSVDANYDVESNNFDAKLNIERFALSNIREYLTPLLNISDIEGYVGLNAKARGNVSEIMKTDISGTVSIDSVALLDLNNESIAKLGKLFIDINQINIENNRFYVNELSIDRLSGQFERYDDHTNFSTLIVKSNSVPDTTTKSEPDTLSAKNEKPLDVRVGHFELKNSNFAYVDHTLPDPFELPVNNIHFVADNLTTTGHNNAKMTASLPGGAHAMFRWSGNINDWKQNQNIFLAIKGLDMKMLSPWLVAYMGVPFTDGIFGFTSHNTINNSALNGKNQLDIYKVQVGDRRKDVDPKLRLPLKSALYVLKDKDDKILLDVPIKGNIDNPEFNYMKLVWKTLQNLLVKVATSPVRALGNVLGMNSKDLDFIKLDSKQRGFTSEQYHQLNELAQIANYDTSVVITFELQVPPAANDTIRHYYAIRNEMLMRYMTEQGVDESQIIITTNEQPNWKQTGYAISSEIRSDITLELPDDYEFTDD